MTNGPPIEITLKPFPFCGGEAGMAYSEWTEFFVKCRNCAASSGVYSTSPATPQMAMQAWNTRARATPESSLIALLKELQHQYLVLEKSGSAEDALNEAIEIARQHESDGYNTGSVDYKIEPIEEQASVSPALGSERPAESSIEQHCGIASGYSEQRCECLRTPGSVTPVTFKGKTPHCLKCGGACIPGDQREIPVVDEGELGRLAVSIIELCQHHLENSGTPLRTKLCRVLRPYLRTTEPDRCKHGVWAADHCYDCEREHEPVAINERQSLAEKALFYLRYSHGCWCETKPKVDEFHSLGCDCARAAYGK